MIVSARLASTLAIIPVVTVSLLSGAVYASSGPHHHSPTPAVTQATLNRATSRQLLAPIRGRIDQWRASSMPSGEVGLVVLAPTSGMSDEDLTHGKQPKQMPLQAMPTL